MTTRRLLIGLIFTSFLGLLLLDASRNEVQSKENGAPAGYTGCASDYSGRTCDNCHSDYSVASVNGWITSTVPAAGYTPGATYTITATATGAGFPVYGFEVAPLGAAGALVGTPLITNTTDTKLVSSKYVTHTSASISGSGSRSWSFNWTAPAAGTGSVTFYGGFLLGDGDGGEGGDYVKTSTLTVTEASCTSPSQPGAISGNAAPCAGASVTYSVASVSGATSYSWSLPGGWSGSSTTNSITVTAGSTSGTVAVAAVNACGTSPSSAVGVVISTATTPTISTSGSTTFCQGGSVTLTSSAASGYSWSPGGQTTQSITVTSAGTYRVTVTNAGGCTASSSATTVTVNSAPTATITAGGPTTFCQGGSVTLTASAGSSYLWSPAGQTSQSITVSAAGSYAVTVTNASGCSATSAATTVSVTQQGTASITASGPTTFCQGGSVTLNASSGTSYLWSPGGETTPSISVSNAGSYSVTVTGTGGCTGTSSPTTVTVNALPVPTVSAGGPTTFCQGDQVVLSASGGTSYVWSPGGATTNSITVTASGNYSVTATNASGCTAVSNGTAVTVNGAPTAAITANGPTTFCQGGSVTLTASAGTSYLWSPGGETTQSITVGSAGSYSVTVTNAAGCSASSSPEVVTVSTTGVATITASGSLAICDGGSVVLTASSGNSYSWSPGGETTQSITVSAAGSYVVSVTGGCSGVSDPAVVTVNPNPVVTITASGATTVCAGDPLNLSASSGASYLWSPGGETTQDIQPGSSGNYSVTVTDGNGCSGTSDPTSVTINPLPVVGLTGLAPVCDTAAAFALSGGSPVGGTYSGPGVSNGSFDPAVAGVGNSVIAYSFTDANGCSASASTSITVQDCTNGGGGCTAPPSKPRYLIGPRIISCGQTGIVYSVPTDTAASSYVWSVPTGAVIVADNGNSITVDFPAGAQTGDICVTAVNACGSSDPLCRTILVGGLYTRRIRGPQEVCRTDNSVTYYNPQVAGAVSYSWTIGGNAGMTVSGNNVTINFSSCTLNWVVLRVEVSNACGDVRSRSLWIHVRDCNGGGHDDDDDDDDDDDGDGHHGDDDRLLSPFANVAASLELQVFPNPSAGLFTVAVPEGYAGTVRVRVADLSGKELYRAEQTLDAGSQQLQIDGNAFAPGVYFLRVEQDGAVGNERIIIAR